MKLQKISGLERDKIKQEHENLKNIIAELKEILGDEQKILDIIKGELEDLKQKYGDERRTQIVAGGDSQEINVEDLIEEHDCAVTITNSGYIN